MVSVAAKKWTIMAGEKWPAAWLRDGLLLRISGHEEDNRIYECAVAAKAEYIVTENTRHFKKPYKTTKIVTARQLLHILEAGQG